MNSIVCTSDSVPKIGCRKIRVPNRSGAARGQFQRKGTTGSLQRQSVISKRDSSSTTHEGLVQSPVDIQHAEPEPVSKGVQLEDKPMDFD